MPQPQKLDRFELQQMSWHHTPFSTLGYSGRKASPDIATASMHGRT